MGRFTYQAMTWDALCAHYRNDARGLAPARLASWLGVRDETIALWSHDREPAPTWFIALFLSQPAVWRGYTGDMSLAKFLQKHLLPSAAVARLLGVNPTTARRWASGAEREPFYMRKALSLMGEPGGISRMRAVAALLILEDKAKPGVRRPFLVDAL